MHTIYIKNDIMAKKTPNFSKIARKSTYTNRLKSTGKSEITILVM